MNQKIQKKGSRKQRMQPKAKEAMQFADLIRVVVLPDAEMSEVEGGFNPAKQTLVDFPGTVNPTTYRT